MFEDNRNNIDQDILFRSILEEGQEPVPAHLWDGVEAGLDRIARRRSTVIWFRRTSVSIAAAAVLALGLFIDWGSGNNMVNPVSSEGLIALVEPESHDLSYIYAMTRPAPALRTLSRPAATAAEAKEEIVEEKTMIQGETEKKPAGKSKEREDYAGKYIDLSDDWPEDEPEKKKIGKSIVLSGLTGTNSAQNSSTANLLKRPSISAAPKKNSIKETSTNTTYGIPLSIGAGVKFDFNDHWSIGTGLNYTLLTRRFYGTYTSVAEDGTIQDAVSSDIRNSQHYLGIPINVYYNILNNNFLNLYTYAGGAVEKNIADRYMVLSTSIIHKEKVKGVQLSANIGMGMEFMLGKHLGLYIDPSLRYYFDCKQPKSIRTAQPFMLGFEMGIRARL